MNNYYVYFHINPVKNKIFYVGMGSGNRAYKYGRNPHWESTVKKYGWIVDIVEEGLTEQEAKEREKFYIKKIGREILTNMTDGGEGTSGLIHSEETKKKISVIHKGKKISEEQKKIIGKASTLLRLGKKLSEETKKKISNSLKGHIPYNKGKKLSEDECKKMSQYLKGRKAPNKKQFINIETNKIYNCSKQICEEYGYKYSTFMNTMNGNIKTNKTPFQYYNPSN